MKLLVRLVIVLLVLALLLAGGVVVFFDGLVKGAVEKGGSYATGVPVTLEGVDAALMSGSFDMNGLNVANPEGFRPEPFLRLGQAHAAWQNGTVLSDAIVIDEFRIDGVTLNLERNDERSNFGVILDSVGRLSPGQGDSGGDAKPSEGDSKGGRKLTIRRIVLRDVNAAVHVTALGGAVPSASVRVPEVVIENFQSDGSTTEIVGQLTGAIVQAILDATGKAGAGVLPADMMKDLRGQVDAIQSRARSALDEAKRDLGGAVDGLKGLLKQPK